MERSLAELRILTAAAGFDIMTPCCAPQDVAAGIRGLDGLPNDRKLTEQQRSALLENLRMTIVNTATAPDPLRSLFAQSRLGRWRFLRQASPEAADAYATVLRSFGIVAPVWLLEQQE